jgi:DNA-binding transcriptional regulator YiaG
VDGRGIKDALEELSLSQESFAKLIQVSERTVSRWASGELRIPRAVDLLLVFATYQPNSFREIVKAQSLLDDEL